jgi:hypothetical protein
MDRGPANPVTLRGWATFARQSNYGRFYLIDCEDAAFRPPTKFTIETEMRSLYVSTTGMVIYTADCLQQHICIPIYDFEPVYRQWGA